MAVIRPDDLPPAASVPVGAAIAIDTGSTVEKATPSQIVDSATPLASQAEAEAGTNNQKRMTPLRVAQAINALGVSSVALASGGAGQGAAIVGYKDTAANSQLRDAQGKLLELGRSAFDFATSGERTSFSTFSAAQSAQTVITNAGLAAQAGDGKVLLPYGKLPVTQILVPADNSADNRGRQFTYSGTGTGEAFVDNDAQRKGTVIVGTDATKAALKTRVKVGETAGQSSGTLQFDNFRVEHTGNSGVPAVDLATFYGSSSMTRVDIYQAGAGDGLHVGFMATGKIEMGYILSSKWGGGVPFTGRGFWLKAAIDAALQTVSKVTSRGFLIGYQFGETGGNTILSGSIQDSESSNNTYGAIISASCKGTGLERFFSEGTQYPIVDGGFATAIYNCFAELAFATAVELTGKGGGVTSSYWSMEPAGATGVKVANTVGDYGAYVHSTYFRWSGVGGTNVVGVEITAQTDPLVSLVGNAFDPPGQWVGSGCQKIKDSSHSSAHGGSGSARGSGVFGLMQRESGNFRMMPAVSRGTVNLHVDEDTLVDADVTANVLALSAASVQQVTFSSAQVVNRFTAINLPDKTGKLYFTNGNVTLTAGTYINGIARDIKLPSGHKAWIEYQVLPSADAPVSITNIQLADTSFTVAQLADLKGDFSQTIFASNGRRSGEGVGAGTGCPVWWDGTNWRTFYDNSTVAA